MHGPINPQETHGLTLLGEATKGARQRGLPRSTPQSVRSVDGLYKRVRPRGHRSGASCRRRPRGLHVRVRDRGAIVVGRAFYEMVVFPVAPGVLPAVLREGLARRFPQGGRLPKVQVKQSAPVLVPP